MLTVPWSSWLIKHWVYITQWNEWSKVQRSSLLYWVFLSCRQNYKCSENGKGMKEDDNVMGLCPTVVVRFSSPNLLPLIFFCLNRLDPIACVRTRKSLASLVSSLFWVLPVFNQYLSGDLRLKQSGVEEEGEPSWWPAWWAWESLCASQPWPAAPQHWE